MKHGIPFAFLCLILASCGPSLPYRNDYPLTGERFHSRNAEFSGRVPEGWFIAPLDSLPSMYKVWLIKEGYGATFHVVELELDDLSRKEVHDKGLGLLAQISLEFHRESTHPATILAPPKEFKLLGREYCGYELQDDEARKRVVVFSTQNRYFECIIAPDARALSAQDLASLFSTQQTVLSTLVFK